MTRDESNLCSGSLNFWHIHGVLENKILGNRCHHTHDLTSQEDVDWNNR